MSVESLFIQAEPVVPLRQLHLDLKGLPPKVDRFLRLLEIAAAARYNQILLEWEDTFPWTCDERFRGETCYSPEDVAAIRRKAAELELELIPLVQCLGHMETPLQLPDYAELREEPHLNMSINPLAPGATELVLAMVDDVLELMPDLTWFHLGGDESWSFGKHPDTAAFIAKHGKAALFRQYLEPLLSHLEARGLRPMLWHDMLQGWPIDDLRAVGARAEIMIWGYRGTPWTTKQKHFTVEVIEHFAAAEIPLWGVGTFKCGSLQGYNRALIEEHIDNMQGWVRAAREFDFRGICVTGWNRNTTADVQYMPIDANLDTLVQTGMLHDGANVPMADCVALLDELGEGDSFRERAAAVEHFDAILDARWNTLRYLRQFVTNFQTDPTRRPGSMEELTLQNVLTGQDDVQAAAEALVTALESVVDRVWLERLVNARLVALDRELELLQADWPRHASSTPVKA